MDFSQIAIILSAAALFGIIAKLLKQPVITGYLLAGVLLGLTGIVKGGSFLESFGQIGVTLLLFLMGLEMNIRDLSSVGGVALVAAAGQIIISFLLGLLLTLAFGFGLTPSLYIAIGITFSSTIIGVKLLTEKKQLSSLYGRLTVSILLIQDLLAILLLMFLSGLAAHTNSLSQFGLIGIKAVILFGGVWFLSKKILPFFFERFISSSQELLFIVSIAWALGIAAFVAGPLGFNLEIGGFIAGISLSNLSEHLQIGSKSRSLRDFFMVAFFLSLGFSLFSGISSLHVLVDVLILSAFVLFVTPLILLLVLGFLGYKKRTAFFVGLHLSQVSEFSLIIMSVGLKLGNVNNEEVSIVVLTTVITMILSTYAIYNAELIYKRFKNFFGIFERKISRQEVLLKESNLSDHVILVGCDRTGRALSLYFKRNNVPFVVVDFNPKVFRKLTADNIPIIFGDVNDEEVVEAAHMEKAKLIISTTSNIEDDLILLEYLRKLKVPPVSVFTALTKPDAVRLYESGASYVIVPEMVAGEHITHILDTYGMTSPRIQKMGQSHFNRLIYK